METVAAPEEHGLWALNQRMPLLQAASVYEYALEHGESGLATLPISSDFFAVLLEKDGLLLGGEDNDEPQPQMQAREALVQEREGEKDLARRGRSKRDGAWAHVPTPCQDGTGTEWEEMELAATGEPSKDIGDAKEQEDLLCRESLAVAEEPVRADPQDARDEAAAQMTIAALHKELEMERQRQEEMCSLLRRIASLHVSPAGGLGGGGEAEGCNGPRPLLGRSLDSSVGRRAAVTNLQEPPQTPAGQVDAILRPSEERFVVDGGRRAHDVWTYYKRMEASLWTAGSINMNIDRLEWRRKLTQEERDWILQVLSYFVSADGVVLENLATRFMSEVQLAEARNFYAMQIANEAVHSETYEMLLDALCEGQGHKARLKAAMRDNASIRAKNDWALRWISDDGRPIETFGRRLVGFAIVEGLFFSASFCCLVWVKRFKKCLPGLCFSNDEISRDEGLHCDFACLLHNNYLHHQKCSMEEAHQMMREAVRAEKLYVQDGLKVDLLGMNSGLMCQYVEFVADRLLVALRYPKLYDALNPFLWMEAMSLQGKTNFFERSVSEYQRAGVMTRAGVKATGDYETA